MSKQTITLLLILCGCTYTIMFITDKYLMAHLGELTMIITNKYLIGGWNHLDRLLLTFFPLIIGVVFILSGFRSLKDYLVRIIWTFLLLLISLILGLTVALMTWQNLEGDYILLPKYIKHQPFTFYWTIFICLGIIGSISPILLNRKKGFISNDLIDK